VHLLLAEYVDKAAFLAVGDSNSKARKKYAVTFHKKEYV